jgi:hypothetical protein
MILETDKADVENAKTHIAELQLAIKTLIGITSQKMFEPNDKISIKVGKDKVVFTVKSNKNNLIDLRCDDEYCEINKITMLLLKKK